MLDRGLLVLPFDNVSDDVIVERRVSSNPWLIGLLTGGLAPFLCIVWAIRQRSWLLGVAPLMVVMLWAAGPALSLDNKSGDRSYSKYVYQGVAGIVAGIIVASNKRKAKESGKL